ncbi:MAG: SRPBCC family protein [Myxococcota bacterium]
MNHRLPRAFAFALVLAATAVPAPSSAQDAIQTFREPTDGTDVTIGAASGLVRAPAEEVVGVLSDYANYVEFMPHFKTSRVLGARGSRANVYVEAAILHDSYTLWAQVTMRVRDGAQPGQKIIEATMTRGNVDRFIVRWEVQPVDATSALVTFRLLVDPDLPVPDSLVSSENERWAQRTLGRLRTRVDLVGRT